MCHHDREELAERMRDARRDADETADDPPEDDESVIEDRDERPAVAEPADD